MLFGKLGYIDLTFFGLNSSPTLRDWIRLQDEIVFLLRHKRNAIDGDYPGCSARKGGLLFTQSKVN